MKKKPKNKVWVEVVLNDIHIPNENKKALSCAMKVIEEIKPNGVTLNGDIGDCATFSRHTRFAPPKCHWSDSQYLAASKHEYDKMNKFLDHLDHIAPKARKRYEMGNHELWVSDFVNESKEARFKQFDLATRLKLKARGYELYKYNDFIKLGKLNITHGIYVGSNHAKKHVDAMGSSILYGHNHDIQVYSKVTPDKQSHMAWCNGCLSNLNPEYMRNRPQNWSHGFAIVYVWPNGEFQVDIIRIQNGKCVVNGKEFIG